MSDAKTPLTDPDALTLAPVTPPSKPDGFVARFAFPILLTGLLFAAFSPILVRLSDTGPISTAAGRLMLPLPVFLLLLAFRRQDQIPLSTPTGRHDFWLLVASGVFFAGDMVFWNLSVMNTSVTNATVLANVTPVFVVLAGWLFFKERVGRLFLAGMLVAASGSAVMMSQSVSMSTGTVRGDIFAVIAAMFYAGYVLTLSRARQRASIIATSAIGGAASVAILLVLALTMEDQLLPYTLKGWMAIITMATLVQVGGQMLIALSLSHLSAGLVATMFLSQPLIPGFTAWLLFDEGVTIYQVIGAVALLAGLEISRRGSPKKAK